MYGFNMKAWVKELQASLMHHIIFIHTRAKHNLHTLKDVSGNRNVVQIETLDLVKY